MASICDLATERNAGVFVCDNTIKTLTFNSAVTGGNLYDLELQDGTICTFILNGSDIVNITLTTVPNDSTPINYIIQNIVELLNDQADVTELLTLAQDLGTTAGEINTTAQTVIDTEALISPHYEAIDTIYDNIDKVITVNNLETQMNSIIEDKIKLDSIYSDKVLLTSIYSDKSKLDSIYQDKDTYDSLYADKAKLDSIFSDRDALNSLFTDKAKLDSLYADKAKLDDIFNSKSNIDLLALDLSQQYSYIEDCGSINSAVEVNTGVSNISIVSSNMGSVNTVGSSIANVNTNAINITSINTNASNILAIQNAEANANTATTKASEAKISASEALNSKGDSVLAKYEAEAFMLTANSYATEPEDVFVKTYTSDGDGTFTVTNTTEYSALHWRNKAQAIVTGDALLIANNLSDLSNVETARSNLGLDAILDSVTTAIANLATAQASITNDGSIDITTTQQLIGINTNTPSTDTTILDTDDALDTMTFKINASINFFANMVFTSSTPNARNISIKVINTADDAVLECFDMALTIPNGSTETISHAFLLTIGKNSTPVAPLTVRFEIVADDTGYSLDSFNSVVATSSSYDLSSDASGINFDNTASGSTATNVQDALDEALDLDLGGIV